MYSQLSSATSDVKSGMVSGVRMIKCVTYYRKGCNGKIFKICCLKVPYSASVWIHNNISVVC